MDDGGSTKIISHSFELDGIDFSWWSIGESPALVTVSSRWFGRKAEFRAEGNEQSARQIAQTILLEQRAKAAEAREKIKEISERRKVR